MNCIKCGHATEAIEHIEQHATEIWVFKCKYCDRIYKVEDVTDFWDEE